MILSIRIDNSFQYKNMDSLVHKQLSEQGQLSVWAEIGYGPDYLKIRS